MDTSDFFSDDQHRQQHLRWDPVMPTSDTMSSLDLEIASNG